MDKSALSTIIVLLLLLAAQVHALECQEITTPSRGANGFVSTIRTEEDLVRDAGRELQSTTRSYADHDAKTVGAARSAVRCSEPESSTTTSSPNRTVSDAAEPPQLTRTRSPKLLPSSINEVNVTSNVATRFQDSNETVIDSRSKSGVSTVRNVKSNSTAAPQASILSNTPLPSSAVHKITSSQPEEAAQTINNDVAHPSSSTLNTSVERVPVKSSFLELSSSPTQVKDGAARTSVSSPTSKETVSTGKASLADQSASSAQTKVDPRGSTSSSSSATKLLFYSCLVVGVAGLVGAVLAYSIEWRVGAKDSDGTSMHSTTWSSRPSEVHVVMDGRNFAIL
uniref:RxLR effector candidate protein n=1 Tax=Hyaloperonospora arabidopsidis (strain Emoy2) TaxID=559515 RepID=M4BJA7_HYAAE